MKQKRSYSISIIAFLIALHLNSTLFCMDIKPSRNLIELLETIPPEIVPSITYFAAPPQWWYLQKTYECNKVIYGAYFDTQEKLIEITNLQNSIILRPQEKQFVCLTNHGPSARFGYFDISEQQFITEISDK